jgi:UDP-N-acetylmuramate--alanine ligase
LDLELIALATKPQMFRAQGPDRPSPRVHLIGALGAGMRALAEVLAARGWRMSGSDSAAGADSRLPDGERAIYRGHSAEHVPTDADLVIHSAAVPPNNPERKWAAELSLAQCSYAQMLGQLMRQRRGLAIAGVHGKSTTTAMATAILCQAGLDPTVVGGGTPLGRDSGGRNGAGDWLLAEACEYRRHFLELTPTIAVVLNIEPDHFDCYASRADLEDAFAGFVGRVSPGGLVLANADCSATRRATETAIDGRDRRVATFGLAPNADWRATNLRHRRGCYSFQINCRARRVCQVALRVPGRFQVYNALAAAAAACEAGASAGRIHIGLRDFRGLRRRLEAVADGRGVARSRDIVLIDDYAHHPSAVAASLAAVRQMYGGRRVWCIFQPHQSLRTYRLLDEFAASLQNADCVAIADVFRARESLDEPPRATAEDLARATRSQGAMVLPPHDADEILEQLLVLAAPGDVIVAMGAGDIGKVCNGFIERI